MWYRVFGRSESEPSPAALAEHLHAAGVFVEPHFKGDDLGWTSGELRLPNGTVEIQRYLTKHDDLRDDLNAYAAQLETCDYSPNSTMLMQHAIQTKQLITLSQSGDAVEATVERLLEVTCRFLAAATDGVYQIDGRGWFAASGEMLLREHP
ncbi:MAG: hypothetical protein K8U57_25335 [Planctomycetes bacterium]|nr:hypothetical protein [Planctomycetota bacterium]